MTDKKKYDLIVIGGGPGGYVAAIRAAQLSLKVLCIEKRKSLGGTCLNVGCIPSKTLLHSSYLYNLSKKHFIDIGIDIEGEVKVDLSKMMSNKSATVKKLTDGIDFLLKKNKVSFIEGNAKIIRKNLVSVNGEEFSTKNILIATGSVPSEINNVDIDEKDIVSSTGALEFSKYSKKFSRHWWRLYRIRIRICLEKIRVKCNCY